MPPRVFRLTITLRETQPPIWRRVLVPEDITLPKLHTVIQVTMGWTNSHLHQFDHHGGIYGTPDPDFDFPIHSEKRVKLKQLLHFPGELLVYEYDFGDGWEHEVRLDAIEPNREDVPVPSCVAGERRCPPEDCGGVHGFYEFLEAIGDRKHPEHKELLRWYGGPFDPDGFSVEATNRLLKRYQGRQRGGAT